jgi:hypothetical protein
MNCGHESEVNSDGTKCSTLARMGAAANLTGMSNSEIGRSGSVCCSSFEDTDFLELEQERNKVIPNRRSRFFNGYLIIIKNEYNIPPSMVEVFRS